MYRWGDHTGELELSVWAPDEAEIFRESLAAVSELIGERPTGERMRRTIDLSAADRGALLVEWLNELVFLAETEAYIAENIVSLDLRVDGLCSTVEGRRGSPRHLVKAVTYNRLEFGKRESKWQARVVLDV